MEMMEMIEMTRDLVIKMMCMMMMEMDDDCDDDQDHRDGGYDARPGHQDDWMMIKT